MADAFPTGAQFLDRVIGETGRIVDSGRPGVVELVYDFSADGKVRCKLPLAGADKVLVRVE